MDFKRISLATAILGSALTLSACSGGSSSGSDENKGGETANASSFTFTVNETYSDLSSGNSVTQRVINYLISPAFAALGSQNIQVVRVDAEGKVLEVLEPKEGPTEVSDGKYRVVLHEGEAVNHVIVVNPEGPLSIHLGQTLNPAEYMFTPAVDDAEEFEVGLASTAAYHLFLQEADSFDNITSEEVDRIMDAVAKKVENLNVAASDRTEMFTGLLQALSDFVKVETKLVEVTELTEPPAPTGTVEGDRAKIKAFFDDLNTIAALSTGLVDENQQGAAEQLYSQVNSGQLIWQASASSLEDLAEIQMVLANAMSDLNEGGSQTIAPLFSNYSTANLTGSISRTASSFTINMSGSFGELSVVELNGSAQTSTTTAAAVLTLSGKVESPEAVIALNNSKINLTTVNGINTAVSSPDYSSELIDQLNSATVVFDASITAKKLFEREDGNFDGKVDLTMVRSGEWVEFAGEDANPFYNVQNFSLDGRFDLGDEYVEAKVEAEQTNATTYLPLTQQYVEGETYIDLVSYSYNGSDTFVIHGPGEEREHKAMSHRYEVLTFANTTVYDEYHWDNVNPTFSDYVNSKDFQIYAKTGQYHFNGRDLSKGSGTIEATTYEEQNLSTVQVNYHFDDESLKYYINEFESSRSYILKSTDDSSTTIEVTETTGESAYKWYGGYANSLESYMKDRHEYLWDVEGGYIVHLNDLVKGTLGGTVMGYLYYSNTDSPAPATKEFTYDYTDAGFVINKGSENAEIRREVLGINEYDGLRVDIVRKKNDYFSGQFVKEQQVTEFADSYESFESYLQGQFFEYSRWDGFKPLGYFELNYGEAPLVGTNNPVSAFLYESQSLLHVENNDRFREFNLTASLTTELIGLGKTEVKATIDRTGFDDGVATLKLSNEHTNLSSEIKLTASVVDNEISTLVLSNHDGLSITDEDIQLNEDGFEMTFGLESAVVQQVGTGIKVTYSNGQFDLY